MALMINRNIIEIQTECTAEYTQYSVHQVLCKHSTLHTQYSAHTVLCTILTRHGWYMGLRVRARAICLRRFKS